MKVYEIIVLTSISLFMAAWAIALVVCRYKNKLRKKQKTYPRAYISKK